MFTNVSGYAPLVVDGNWGNAINVAINDALNTKWKTLFFEEGDYVASGINLKSNIKFLGDGNSNIIHPNGMGNTSIINNSVNQTTGNISNNSNILIVSSSVGFSVNDTLGIRCGNGGSEYQYSLLINDITDISNTLILDDVFGLSTSGFLIIENEIVQYTGKSGNTLTGLTRGLYGTIAQSHSAGVLVSFGLVLYANITNINGNVITLDTLSKMTLTNTPIFSGVKNVWFENINFNGNKPVSFIGGNPDGIVTKYSRDIFIDNCTFSNFVHAAVSAENGSKDFFVTNCDFNENGYIDGQFGGAVWAFGGSSIIVKNSNFVDNWGGVFLDDRSNSSTENDAQCYNCAIRDNAFSSSGLLPVSINVAGTRDSCIVNNDISSDRGILVYTEKQGTNAIPTNNIVIDNNRLSNGGFNGAFILLDGPELVWFLKNNTFSNCVKNINDFSDNNPIFPYISPFTNIAIHNYILYDYVDDNTYVRFVER